MNRAWPAALAAILLLTGCAAPAQPAQSGAGAPGSSSESSAPAGSGVGGGSAESSAEPDDPAPVSPVYTDWSKLTPYQPTAPLYSRFQPYQGGALTARDDYGSLVPYLGAEPEIQNYISDRLSLFGLATADGRVVTDPIYASISVPTCPDPVQQELTAPFLILRSGDPADTGNGMFSQSGDFQCTIAARDGSWLREFGSAGTLYLDEDRLAVIGSDDSVTVLTASGETAAYFPGSAFTPFFPENGPGHFSYEGGPQLSSKDGVLYVDGYDAEIEDWRIFCYLDLEHGTVQTDPPAGFSSEWPDNWPNNGNLTPTRDPVSGTLYFFRYLEYGKTIEVLNADKRHLQTLECSSSTLYVPLIYNDCCGIVRDGAFCYVDLHSVKDVFRFPLLSNGD